MQIFEALLFLIAFHFHCTVGILPKCQYSVVFKKILGQRPVSGRNNTPAYPLYTSTPSQSSEVVNVKCVQLCRQDPLCFGYLLVFSRNTCYGYTNELTYVEARYDYIDESNYKLITDANAAFFIKSCLDVPPQCAGSKLFPIVTIPASSLVGHNFRQHPKLVTRDACINVCLREAKFACRSLRFVRSIRNNRQRLWSKLDTALLGQCFLSRDDRFTNPEAFRRGWDDEEEYIENQCSEPIRQTSNCSFEQHRDLMFLYFDDSVIVPDERSCSEKCLNEKRFACLGYTYSNSSLQAGAPVCHIHSEDLISLGPKAVNVLFGAVYSRRIPCLELETACSPNNIAVSLKTQDSFQGRLYYNTLHINCSKVMILNGTQTLEIQTGNELAESRCGIRRAFIKGNMFNYLVFGYIYIQNFPEIRIQSDRLIKVGCIHRDQSKNMTSLINNMPMVSTVDFIPINQMFSIGKMDISNGTVDVSNQIISQLIDVETGAEIFEATLGQLIEMRLSTEVKDRDMMIYDLMAYSGDNQLVLINSQGCPGERRIITDFRKDKNTRRATRVARFHAFMFSSTATLNFKLKIKFCYDACPKTVCYYQ